MKPAQLARQLQARIGSKLDYSPESLGVLAAEADRVLAVEPKTPLRRRDVAVAGLASAICYEWGTVPGWPIAF